MREFLLKTMPITCILLLFFSISTTSLCNTQFKIDSLSQLIKQSQSDKNTDAEIKLLNEVIDVYSIQGNWAKYEIVVRQLLRLAEQTKNKAEIAGCYNKLGISNAYKGNNHQSLEYFNKALNCNIEEKDTVLIANSYENIGMVYKDLGNYEKAVEYQLKSLTMRSGTEYNRIFNNYISLTVLYGLLNNPHKQDVYIAKAREELQKSSKQDYKQLAIFNNEIAHIYNSRD